MQENKSQAERFGGVLQLLKIDVTAEDRSAAMDELSLSKPTITRYLKGEVDDNDTAAKIISFFKNRIAKREKVLS